MSNEDEKPRKRRRRFGSIEQAGESTLKSSNPAIISPRQVGSERDEVSRLDKSPDTANGGSVTNEWAGCRSVENYERLNFIDEGTYGRVYRARETATGKVYALKQLKVTEERNGFPVTSLREVSSLFRVSHINVVRLKEVVVSGGVSRNVFMVLEYASHDMYSLLERMKRPYSASEVKSLMLQILAGVNHLHENWIVHRDLKPANLLLTNEGVVKICDFGLAKNVPVEGDNNGKLTPGVTTLWYRAPEILMCDPRYTTAIDMWAVGCIFAELILMKPLLQGSGELDQLRQMCELLGPPSESVWGGFNELPHATKLTFPHKVKKNIRDTLAPENGNNIGNNANETRRNINTTGFLSPAGVDLIEKMLVYDPKRRISAEAAMQHEYFTESPPPKERALIQTFPDDRRG